MDGCREFGGAYQTRPCRPNRRGSWIVSRLDGTPINLGHRTKPTGVYMLSLNQNVNSALTLRGTFGAAAAMRRNGARVICDREARKGYLQDSQESRIAFRGNPRTYDSWTWSVAVDCPAKQRSGARS